MQRVVKSTRVERSQLLISAWPRLHADWNVRREFFIEDRDPARNRRPLRKWPPILAMDAVGIGDETLVGTRSKMVEQSGSLLEFRGLQRPGIDDRDR